LNTRVRAAASVLALVMLATPAMAGHAASSAAPTLSHLAASRLDPRLVRAIGLADPEPIPVWVTFADKGERGAEDLATRLEAARLALTPRALARRLRAHVWPIVDYRDLPLAGDYLAGLEARGFAIVATSRWLNRAAVRVPAAQLTAVAELPFVVHVAPVERMRRSLDPAGAVELPAASIPRAATPARATRPGAIAAIDYGLTTNMLKQMNVPAVHDSGYIGTGVLACILDDGFNNYPTHEALAPVVIEPGMRRDFVDGDTVVTGVPGGGAHGTSVMGCVAGNKPGTYVGSGFGAHFALARTEVDASETPVEMLYWGMGAEWADSLGADLITSSLGYTTFDNPADNYTYADMDGHTTTVTRAAEIAASKGILVVNAVGNEGNTGWHYLIAPADVRTDSLIAVGAVDKNGARASFSSYGPNAAGCTKPDVVARGLSDTLTSTTGGYFSGSGTSFATPLVAGLAVCLLQARPSWPATYIARALRETASQASSPDNSLGWGIPNGLAALRWDPAVSGVVTPQPTFGLRMLGPNPLHTGGPPLRLQLGLGAGNRHLAAARVRVIDTLGRELRTLWSGNLCCDETIAITWDGRDQDGARARPGLYFVALEEGDHRSGLRVAVLP
jgi:serine protease AprX